MECSNRLRIRWEMLDLIFYQSAVCPRLVSSLLSTVPGATVCCEEPAFTHNMFRAFHAWLGNNNSLCKADNCTFYCWFAFASSVSVDASVTGGKQAESGQGSSLAYLQPEQKSQTLGSCATSWMRDSCIAQYGEEEEETIYLSVYNSWKEIVVRGGSGWILEN